MARALNRLTVREVAALKVPGRHADGGGLYLRISPSGARSWAFMYVTAGKRIELGLGSASALTLAMVRKIAADMREAAALGRDPREVLAPAESVSPGGDDRPVTFGAFADEYIGTIEDGWKSEVHRKQWRNSLRDHAAALHDLPIEAIDTDGVLKVLRPIWLTKAETAKRVRGRIERILDAAKVRGLRPRDSINPAGWRGHLALLLPSQSKIERGHHAALPYLEGPSFFAKLQSRPARAVFGRAESSGIHTASVF